MEEATLAADNSVIHVGVLAVRQQRLQTEYIKNENRVNRARGKTLNLFVVYCCLLIIFKEVNFLINWA